ncbi:peptidoglycan D,D-transpeptidase FtsI family protein [Lichenibacterium ramalinae]|uniref:Penicillin-binding protein 2 n=1 Tax=Lichenibacterium ramalinae TaxID=2316527 RepID=A0A4Q2RB90_9HYPH|nr:penicillin-binding protein 2 [Lichenibacterium ramalinae]RYB02900.1 penicillin-binding protein 2 [Lichenibacterium ramalinae]
MTGSPDPRADRPRPAPGLFAKARVFVRDVCTTRLDKSGFRLRLLGLAFLCVYGLIDGKLIKLGLSKEAPAGLKAAASDAVSGARPELLDRNGGVLAQDIKTMSVFAEPRRLIDKDEAVELLTAVLPDVDATDLRKRLGSRKGFVWVKRGVTDKQQQEVFRLGLPGVGFLPENKRIYPNGPVGAHVLGFTNTDNQGIAGIEKWVDNQGLGDLKGAGFDVTPQDLKPISLSLDTKATFAVRDELLKGMARFHPQAASGAIMDVNTGEMIAYVSLPDYDPNNPVDALKPDHINRLNVGTYEMGSTFKAISIAMALELNKVTLKSTVDTTGNLRYGRATIHDYEKINRPQTIPEVFIHSSNIGTAKMVMMVGVDGHKTFLRKMGELTRLQTELPETASPQIPPHWGVLNSMTIAFGQGLNVTPLQAIMAVGALANGGYLITPTFLKRDGDARDEAKRVVRPEVSEDLRYLMRLNATLGSAKKANVPGYFAGGKTGTADKLINGHYAKNRVNTTFMSVVPADHPKYLFFVMMEDPQAAEGTYGFHTAAWNSGDVCGKIMERVAPLLNLPPNLNLPTDPFPAVAKLGIGMDTVLR